MCNRYRLTAKQVEIAAAPLVTAQNFLQIVGLAIVVVRFLHSGTKQATEADRF